MKHSPDWKVKKKIIKRAGWTYEVFWGFLESWRSPQGNLYSTADLDAISTAGLRKICNTDTI